jgi:hypothetical protein
MEHHRRAAASAPPKSLFLYRLAGLDPAIHK